MDMQKETIFSEVETANSKQIAVLKANFPQCFDKNGAFLQEKLLEIVKSSDVELSKESYSLNWLGKSYARLLANLPPKTLLTEDKDHNQRKENKNSQNLLIKGDNLEVLKHMVNAYSEKIKMIYIDPPYNTGSDGFVYNDERNFTAEQLSELAGIDIDEATRILNFTVKGSSSHSAWLTFIYPRLYIARELLREDGVIFISIDDNEVAQLKLLCDEIFGEENFLSQIIVQSNKRGQTYKEIAKCHEYILVYYKSNKSNLGELEKVGGKLPFEDSYGAYDLWELRNRNPKFGKHNRPNLFYPIYVDENHINEEGLSKISLTETLECTTPVYPMNSEGVESCWRWGKDKLQKEGIESEPQTVWAKKKRDGGWNIYEKSRKSTTKAKSIWFDTKFINEQGTIESGKLDMSGVLQYPKPLELMKQCIILGTEEDDIILDFFAGSGTTAHAVMELNAQENSERSFITVQIPEKCSKDSIAFKSGFETIFDITKERLKRACEKIGLEHIDYKGSLGFKSFETIDDFRVKNESELTLSNHTFFDDAVLTPEQYDSLLTTWCLYDGSLLTTTIEDVELNGYKAHLCDGRLYLIAPNFTSEALKALLHKLDSEKDFAPNKVVFYGSNFESAKQMELNEALKSYANKKSIDLDLVVRN
ncbi:DNA methyltransferase [Klebsiella pneumoniae]|uniref:site-specific DNA-methyltransferase n=1 Tax=Klebsiella pneumoniae TaxID=573 RepID=UPI0013303CAB|nr:site-specific DNA-methyltransferase [Klebsiella pneumoniae]HBR5002460.1 site-specific DNA-methyltransferase [Klebsiella pneumoniae]HCD9699789.1 site-specific DNA-methyltransferase [Klebsiella pneumoniae]HCD9904782.1 site-specific DNA-methyltransferase [Klebsiella pneumoniae]HCE4447642.1 site-specific DNA-methyltransferase [Klebsiella pneumoniae]